MAERIKFASQADADLLSELKQVASDEGRQFQVVLEEAMVYYLENKKHRKVRASVLNHFHVSVVKNRRLAELLAR